MKFVERDPNRLGARSKQVAVLLQGLEQADVDSLVLECDHMTVGGEPGQGVGVVEYDLRCHLGGRVVEVLGEQPRGDSQLECSLVGHPGDLTGADDTEAIEVRDVQRHAQTVAAACPSAVPFPYREPDCRLRFSAVTSPGGRTTMKPTVGRANAGIRPNRRMPRPPIDHPYLWNRRKLLTTLGSRRRRCGDDPGRMVDLARLQGAVAVHSDSATVTDLGAGWRRSNDEPDVELVDGPAGPVATPVMVGEGARTGPGPLLRCRHQQRSGGRSGVGLRRPGQRRRRR